MSSTKSTYISRRARDRLKPKWAALMQRISKLIDSTSLTEDHTTAAINTVAEIGRTTSKSEIVSILSKIGCQDLTERLDPSEFTMTPVSGGGLGDVYQGKLDTGALVAIKCARPHTIEMDMDHMQNTTHEIYIWSRCKHQNILDLFGIARFNDQIAIVSPWMENGVLPDYLRENPGSDRCQLCIQVATGLTYLHETGVIHGDVKGPNILISDNGVAKLADFGNACLTDYTIVFSCLPVYTQSLRWSAPEICGREPLYSREADVYALAMTVLEILTGEVPLNHIRNDARVVFVVAIEQKTPPRPLDIIPTQSRQGNILWSLLERCWAANPYDRPSAEAAKDALALINWNGLTDETAISPEYAAIFESLIQQGCPDLTNDLSRAQCHRLRATSDEPFSYQGALRDGTQVSLRLLVPFFGPSRPLSQQETMSAAEELASWYRCSHSNVIRLLGIAILGSQIVLVYPWIGTTTVVSYLFHRPGANRCLLCLELSRGISYLHNRGLLQRGMDPTSVRISDGGAIVLIACSNVFLDMHRAQLVYSWTNQRLELPELKGALGSYGAKSDIYALGMILFELIAHRRIPIPEPVNGELPTRPYQQIPGDSKCGDNLWRLLNQCWALDPDDRPNASTVVERMDFIDDEGLRGGSAVDIITEPTSADFAASILDLVQGIAGHACPVLDVLSISKIPFSGSSIFGYYEGRLDNSTVVSVATPEGPDYLDEEGKLEIADELAQELHAWSKYNHTNILELLGIAEVQGKLAVITPWLEAGTLPSYLETAQNNVNLCQLSTQIAEGVAYFHSIGVVHGDIHGGNVWVGKDETIKLCNFDSAYMRHSLRQTTQGTQPRFSIHWKAPELFERGDLEVNEATDVWALGMTMLECITRRAPGDEMKEEYVAMRELTNKHHRPKRPTNQIPLNNAQGDTLWDLLTRCWAHEPSDRPSAEEVRDTMRMITSEGLVSDDPTSPISATESHNSWYSAQEN